MSELITVTVIYPVTFQIEIDPSRDIQDLRRDIKDTADSMLEESSMSSVIVQCDEHPELTG